MSNNFGRRILSKLSLKSSRSAPVVNQKLSNSLTKSKVMEKNNLPRQTASALLDVKSAVVVNDGRRETAAQQSQQELDSMQKMVDQTDNELRRAIEHAAIRREQLDELHYRSEEMLSKNENLVFGITNYRKTQERDLFWRRFRYTVFGVITLGVIILLIILSMTSKRSSSSPQIIDIRHSNQDLSTKDLTSTITLSKSRRRKRQIFLLSNEFFSYRFLSSKSKHLFSSSDNNF